MSFSRDTWQSHTTFNIVHYRISLDLIINIYKALWGFLLNSQRHTNGNTLVFLALVKMTEIIHVMHSKKLKVIPLLSNSFETCIVNIANLNKTVIRTIAHCGRLALRFIKV